jgi:hypothetical protein
VALSDIVYPVYALWFFSSRRHRGGRRKNKEPKQDRKYQTKPPMSEGGEKPKSLIRITNIRQSHLCLREERNQRV